MRVDKLLLNLLIDLAKYNARVIGVHGAPAVPLDLDGLAGRGALRR